MVQRIWTYQLNFGTFIPHLAMERSAREILVEKIASWIRHEVRIAVGVRIERDHCGTERIDERLLVLDCDVDEVR